MTGLGFASRVPIARRQLVARRGRTVAGVLGIASALLLVLALKAIFAGMEERLTAYIDGSRADVVVAQAGVQTMHMTQSALPAAAVASIAAVDGVTAAEPIVYVPATVERGDRRGIVYLIGEDDGGAPLRLVAGRRPRRGEIVLDRVLAEQLAVARGDSVGVLGGRLRVAGEVSGLATITNSFAFTTRRDLEALVGRPGVASYVLVRGGGDVDAGTLAARIEAAVPGVTAATRAEFAASERGVVGDMSTDIVRGMLVVGLVIGVAVAGLVSYAQTLTQLRDYGVLRALGLRAGGALALAVRQVAALVVAGFAVAVALALLLAAVLPAATPTLVMSVRPGDVGQAGAIAAAVALGAAVVPVLRVLRLAPAAVFRSGS